MQKAFEKIVERLEENTSVYSSGYGCMSSAVRAISIDEAKKIVNQVAEEYKSKDIEMFTKEQLASIEKMNLDTFESLVRIKKAETAVCEWTERKDRRYFPYKSSCGYRDLMNDDYVYCPYCGKRIKVVE